MTKKTVSVDPKTVSLLELNCPEPKEEARIAMVSLPVPMNAKVHSHFTGLATQTVDVGWWPDSRSGGKRVPRRRLMFGMSKNALPSSFRLTNKSSSVAAKKQIEVSTSIIHKDYKALLPHEVGEARFTLGGKSFGLRLGVRWRDELHWWEWLKLEKLWSGPVVTAYRIGGCIEVVPLKWDEIMAPKKEGMSQYEAVLTNKWLHRQNWLLGEAFILCFANGVIQLSCRHVNNHRFDEGREHAEMTPLIGFSVSGDAPVDHKLDGTRSRFALGDMSLDLSDALPFVSPEHPGSLKRENDLIIYQPYEGVEIEGDSGHRARQDGFLVRASERRFPKGLARTVRFNVSLSEVAPVISRLTAPEWWYALSGDLWPDRVLSVRDALDKRIDGTYAVREDHPGRFDEGFMGRLWEGEGPFAQLLYFYRTGKLEQFRRAIRDAYHMADIAFDHSTETIRMMDYPLDGSTAPPGSRTTGMLFGYLETGDPYLRECAESASSHWYWMDCHMWPRFGYGRDGAGIRGLVFMWDYLGKEDYRAMARDAMGRLIQCQQADGSYRDQGSGTGIHAGSHMPVKPWMANLGNDPVIDYLERIPDDEELRRAVIKYGDFLLDAVVRTDGTVRWPYQVSHAGTDHDPLLEWGNPSMKGKLPYLGPHGFAHGHKPRALNFISRLTGKAKYFDTWLQFYDAHWADQPPRVDDHYLVIRCLQNLPYAQAHSWNARWRNGGLEIAPLLSDQRPEMEATIVTPIGPVTLGVRRSKGKWELVKKESKKPIRVVGRK